MVSEKVLKAELSDAEKRELVLKVYPRLRRRVRFLRLLKIGNAVIMALLMTACAATQTPVQTEVPKEKPAVIGAQIKKGMVQGEDPAAFEKEMPASDVTLSSVVRFRKEPTVRQIADGVTDLDYDRGLLVLLKDDRLETNQVGCPYILLEDDRYLSVRVEKGFALVTGAKKALLADVHQCGVVQEMDSRGKGFDISEDYFLEFSRNRFELFDSRKTVKKHGGDFLGSVQVGQLSGGYAMFANENGKIALMSGETGRYTAMFPGAVDIQQIYFISPDVYVLTQTNELLRLTADFGKGTLEEKGRTQAKEGCFFTKRSGLLYCDGYLYGIDTAYELPVKADRALARDGLIFTLKDGDVSFVDAELTYKKSVLLAATGQRLCLSEGKAFFRDMDGSYRYITAVGAEHRADGMPASCDHSFDFRNGALKTPAGKEIYRYADEVNRSEKAVMLKRVLGEDIYYYFEKLSD